MENFWLVSTQVWVLFALIGVGALCRWMRWVDDATIKGIVNVLILCVTPCLIIDVFQRPYDPAMVRQLFAAFAVAFALHAAIIVAAILFMRGGGAARRPVLRLAMVFSNAGFMGIPLEQAILGDTGVFFGITYVVTFNTFFWSWGLHEMTAKDPSARDPSARPSLLPIFVNPGTIGICAGFGLFLARVALPACLAQPIKMMAVNERIMA